MTTIVLTTAADAIPDARTPTEDDTTAPGVIKGEQIVTDGSTMSPVGIVDASMIMAATTIKQADKREKKISTVVSMTDLVDIKDVFNKF